MTKNNINKAPEEPSSQVQIISKPLKLETVNEGSNEDDVLVRGSDNTVKYVSQSSLGGGGSQTLDQTLTNGDTSSQNIMLTDNKGSLLLTPSNGITLINSISDGNLETNIVQSSGQIGNVTLLTPIKPSGNYVLATREDLPTIGFNEVLNNGHIAAGDNYFAFSGSSFEVGMSSNGFYSSNKANKYVSLGNINLDFTNDEREVQYSELGINVRKITSGSTSSLLFPSPISGIVNLTLPFNKNSGNYTLATLDDITANSPVSGTTTGIVDNSPLQELGGIDKTINGIRIGKGNGTTTENIVLGSANTFGLNTTGDYNTAVGYDSMIANTTGENNSAFGEWALRSNTTGSSNTAIGVNALNANTTGTWNVSIGVNSMNSSVNGYSNVAVGGEALKKNIGGTSNVAVGISSLRDNIGIAASNTNGCHNTALGNSTLIYNVSGAANTAIGSAALARVISGEHNIGIGYQGGSGITGSRNVVIATSGWVVGGGGITTGNNNMVLAPNNGDNTGITTGSGNVVLGKVTGLSASASNTITISDGVGNVAITKSTTGELKTPNLTQALIISGGATSLVTKGYIDNTGAIDNVTSIALSSTTLTTTYPNAVNGFRVHCPYISTGAIIYEKSSIGWLQYAVTITQ